MNTSLHLRRSIGSLAGRRRQHHLRRGSAPLELTVALPLLIWLVAVIMNAGAGGVATTEATIAARVDAFQRAEKHSTAKDRMFLLVPELAGDDVLMTGASRSRSVPPALGKSQLTGVAQLAVFGNVWSRRELPLNDPVHLQLMGRAAAASGAGQLLGPVGEALDGLRSAADQGRQTADELSRKTAELQEEPPAVKQGREQEEAQRRENAKKVTELQQKAATERTEIARLDREIREQEQTREKARVDLKDDAAALEKREAEIAEKIKQLEKERTDRQQQLKRTEGEIALLRQAT
jgi:hypothetical protein